MEALPEKAQLSLVKHHQQDRQHLLGELNRRASHLHPWYTIDPEGLFRRMWDTVAVLLIFFLVWFVPVLVAFFGEADCCYIRPSAMRRNANDLGLTTQLDKGWQIVIITINIFFLIDIVLNFFTGWEHSSTSPVEYHLPAIWRGYLKGWCALDVVASLPLQCMLNAWAPQVYWWNTGYLIRLLRCFGVTRRCRGSPLRWIDRFSTLRKEFSFSLKRMTLSSLGSLLGCHYFACLLFWTLRLEASSPAVPFIEMTYPMPGQLDINDEYVTQHYLWTMFNTISSMIMLTYGSYVPITWGEAIVWTVMMVVVASLFLIDSGQYVPYIMSLAVKRVNFKLQMDAVVEAVESRNLPQKLVNPIINHLKLKYQFTGLTSHDNLWKELPYAMQVEMAETVAGPFLDKLTLFREEPALAQRTALLMKDAVAIAGEELVREGWPARSMYFVQTGVVLLLRDDIVMEVIMPGEFFGGDALLHLPTEEDLNRELSVSRGEVTSYADSFTALATARAAVDCRLLLLDRREFLQVAVDEPSACNALNHMAMRHVKRIVSSGATLRTILAIGLNSGSRQASLTKEPPGKAAETGWIRRIGSRQYTTTFSQHYDPELTW